jgi:hypothetical protein
MKRYFSLILAIAATVSAQIVPSTGNVRGPTSATDNAVARYDGTTGKLVQNSAVTIDDSGNTTAADVILGTSGPSVKSSLSARAPRQGLVFDGTNGASFSAISAFGTGDFTVCAWVKFSALSGNQPIFGGATNSFWFYLNTSVLAVGKVNFSDGTGYSSALVAGKTYHVSYVRSGGTGTYYVNGVADGTSVETGINYSVGLTEVGSSHGNYFKTTGNVSGALVYNRALSAAEVVALYEAGVPAGADYNTASNTAVYSTDFSTSTGWVAESGWSITGGAAVLSGSGAGALFRTATALNPLSRYRITFTVASYVSGGVRPWIQIGSSRVRGTARTANGTYTEELVAPSATGTSYVGVEASTSSSCSLSVDDYAYYAAGLLLAPDAGQAGNGYVWNDQSGNLAQIVLPSSGVQWNLPSVAGQRIRGTTSTNGNQQLLGASVLLPAECQITHVRARARSGTPTITIGTASGGAQIVASVALSTTWLNCTIALTGGIVSSADDIWVGSNSTDVVEIDIAYQPLKL